ncbi:MAG TPA: hypothetical protein VNA11_20075 [Pseudonocardia sp.]|nr:hypothetical protein [Pseudonocardia sp.]
MAGATVATDPQRLGLDVLFAVFYLGLLWPSCAAPGAPTWWRPPRPWSR